MSQFVAFLKEEFRLKNFGFGGVHPLRFTTCQWRLPGSLYITWRLVAFVYCLTWLILSLKGLDYVRINGEDVSQWAFLTIWTYFLLTLYLGVHFVVAIVDLFRHGFFHLGCPSRTTHKRMFHELELEPSLWQSRSYGTSQSFSTDAEDATVITPFTLPIYLKVVWVLFEMITASVVMVTIVFFGFLWPQFNTSGIDMFNFQLHAVNTIILVLEHLVFSAVPMRLLHYIYPFLYVLTYGIFSIIFWAVDHKHVLYPGVLDWNNPGHTVLMILGVGFILMPILHLLFFVIYKVKIFIYRTSCDGNLSD